MKIMIHQLSVGFPKMFRLCSMAFTLEWTWSPCQENSSWEVLSGGSFGLGFLWDLKNPLVIKHGKGNPLLVGGIILNFHIYIYIYIHIIIYMYIYIHIRIHIYIYIWLIINYHNLIWLVVSNMFLFSIIYEIILPIDSYFSRWLKPPTSL